MQSQNEQVETNLPSTNLLVTLFKYRWQIIILCFVAAILSAIASYLIEEKFRSSAKMFATTQQSLGKQLYDEISKEDLLKHGEKEDAERLLQVLNSDQIRHRVIQKFDLWKHYEIERDEPGANTLMQKEYDSNVTGKLTKFGSIQIDVLDKNNITARDMTNYIVNLVDSVSNQMRNDRAADAFEIAKSSYLQAQEEIKLLEDSMDVLSRLGVFDYITQIEGLNDQYATALAEGQPKRAEDIQSKMQTLSKYGNLFNKLTALLEAAYLQEAVLKKNYDRMYVDATSKLPSTFVVDHASAADKKAYPVRWLIVVMSVAATFFVLVLSILALENFKSLKLQGKI